VRLLQQQVLRFARLGSNGPDGITSLTDSANARENCWMVE
jgi:hypothetical protein